MKIQLRNVYALDRYLAYVDVGVDNGLVWMLFELNSTDIDDLGLEPLSHVDPYYQKKRNVDYKIEYSPYSRGGKKLLGGKKLFTF